MAVRVRWSPSTDGLVSAYKIEKATSAAGPWTLAASINHDLSGADFNSAIGLFDWLDEDGTVSSWYRVIVHTSDDLDSEPSAPFQSLALVSPPLADTDEVKAYLGIEHTNDDELIANLIEAMSAFVENYTGQVFRYRLKTEVRDGNGEKSLRLRESPVVDVVSVSVNESPVTESTSISQTGWFLNDGYVRLRNSRFTLGDGNVTVSYTCGYPVVPTDIRQAVIELTSLKYRDRTRIGKSTESISGMSVGYLPSIIPASVQAVLDAHRRLLS